MCARSQGPGCARQHEKLMALAGLPLDKAAVTVLRYVAESEYLRNGPDGLVPEDLHHLAALFRRLVDDFVTHEDPMEAGPPA
ncbi:hypothetical protein ACGFNV_04480 [Streptomyces sp. NPDC048751]|uniref:hypothetical protein n=1 Tax=Streptomyces sp. NPDC048751 TaxID=3365591 RepID=UPI0037185922